MTLSDIASIGEFVSGIAVLISLIYLTVQVRQAKQNQRAALNQGYITRAGANTQWFGDPARTALVSRVSSGETDFTSEEMLQLTSMTRTVLLGAQDAYGQYKAGLIDRMSYDNSILIVNMWMTQPVHRAIWIGMRQTIAPEFRTEIDKVIAEQPVSAPRDMAAEFQNNLAQVMAQAGSGQRGQQ